MSLTNDPSNSIRALGFGTSSEPVTLGYPAITPTSHELDKPTTSNASAKPTPKTAKPSQKTAAPLPKRPKGRLFITILMLSVAGTFAFYFYDCYVRYAAYGEVVGRKIQLAPPWEGVISGLHVRVGDTVRQGDRLFIVESIEMRHRMEKIEDSLNLEHAQLDSELAQLKWEAERLEDDQELVKADFYEKWSELLWEQSVHADLKQQHARFAKINQEAAYADDKLESLKFQIAGKQKRIEQLTNAVRSLKHRLDTDRPLDPTLDDQIKPGLVRIENLQSELRRVRQLLDQGVVTCPSNGRVTQIVKYSGEYVDGTGPVLELFVDGSTEIVLYVPQAKSDTWSPGDELSVQIEPSHHRLTCEVLRLAPEMRQAPGAIMRHYDADQVLLPIIVRPKDAGLSNRLVLGSKVQLPRQGTRSQLDAIARWFRGDPVENEYQPYATHASAAKETQSVSAESGAHRTASFTKPRTVEPRD